MGTVTDLKGEDTAHQFLEDFPYLYMVKGMDDFKRLNGWEELKGLLESECAGKGLYLILDNALVKGYFAQVCPMESGFSAELFDGESGGGFAINPDGDDFHPLETIFEICKLWVSRFELLPGFDLDKSTLDDELDIYSRESPSEF